MRRACLVASLTLLALAVPPASAEHTAARTLRGNLDHDRPWERVDVRGSATRRRIVLVDRCDRRVREHRLTGIRHAVDSLRVVELDGATRRPEIFLDVRDGAGGHVGAVKVVRLGPGRDGTCPIPATLFRFSSDRTDAANFAVVARNWARRHPGKELRLEEELMEPGDGALCCPSTDRNTFFRYSRTEGRYVPYRTFERRNDFR